MLLHLRSRRHGEPPHCVQAKPYKAFNSASLQAFLGIPFFKVSGYFSDTETRYPTWKLRVQNTKYLMHLEEIYLGLSKRFSFLSICRLFHLVFPWNIQRSFFGCPYRSNGTKTWLNAALLKTVSIPRIWFKFSCFSSNISVKN